MHDPMTNSYEIMRRQLYTTVHTWSHKHLNGFLCGKREDLLLSPAILMESRAAGVSE